MNWKGTTKSLLQRPVSSGTTQDDVDSGTVDIEPLGRREDVLPGSQTKELTESIKKTRDEGEQTGVKKKKKPVPE